MNSVTVCRPSFALDLIEPVRPKVDNFVLDMLQRRTFRKAEFAETDDGHCRLRPPLTHELAETLPTWAKELAPVAEKVAHLYGDAKAGKYVASTPLTQEKSRAARAIVKARKETSSAVASSSVKAQRPASSVAEKKWMSPDCGSPVTNHRHVRCEACIAADPKQTPEIRGRRGEAIASRKRALKNWEEKNGVPVHDADFFSREVLPDLKNAKLVEIMQAAGISKSFASQVRSGKFLPHVSTWEALLRIVNTDPKC